MLQARSVRRVALSLLAAALTLVPAGLAAADTVPIPLLPTDLIAGRPMEGNPATAQPLAHPPIPQHPAMAPNGRNSMHNDAYASDTYEVSGPLGVDLQMRTASYGISECATMGFDSRDRIVGLCGGIEGFALRLIDPDDLSQIATMTTSTRDLTSLDNPFTDICGGTYFYLDPHDVVWLLTIDKQVWAVQVTDDGFEKLDSFDLAEYVPGDDCPIATMPDWQGRIFFATQQGRVGVLDPETRAVGTLQFDGEGIFNSMAADEDGVYLVTTHRLARVSADDQAQPRVDWSTTYPRGTALKPGMLSQGSGTTPTLIGRDLVVIADNDEPRMNVRFYQRNGADAGREICSAPVFADGASATENTLAAAGRSVIVENNHGYTGVQSTMLGKTTAPGIARVALEDGECVVKWTNPLSAPTNVPKVSLGNGLLYVYTKDKSHLLDDAWYFTAIDVRTGETVWRQKTGNGIQWNNHYAAIYLGPDGAAYLATVAGLIKLSDS